MQGDILTGNYQSIFFLNSENEIQLCCFMPPLCTVVHIVQAKLGQARTGDNEVKLMKQASGWVRTRNPALLPLEHCASTFLN